MSNVMYGASPVRGKRLLGAALPSIGLLLALGLVSPVGAASIQGADGGNGTEGVGGNQVGAGGDGAGNTGSGGTPMTDAVAAGAGSNGMAGTGGGGGGGGRDYIFSPVSLPANGAAGGNGEFGTGGAGGTITSAAGGGGEEAGGGGGFGASSSNSAGGGGGGGGGRGQTILTTDGEVALGDTITGGAGGNGGGGSSGLYADGGAGGGGGIGVVFGGTGVLSVSGSITGGAGGNGGVGGYAGSGGVGGSGLRVTGSGATVYVDGAVAGGDGGERAVSGYLPTKAINGAGGAGIIGADLSVVLGVDGSISGGLGGDALTRANAVTFTSGANSFELQGEASGIVGKVVANGTDDVFRLGGTSTEYSFDTALLGTQITGFESFQKVGTGTWTLTGTPGVSTAWSVNEGTLALPGAMTTDIATAVSGTFALQGGTLDGALDNAGTTIGHGTVTGAITNQATGNFALDGDLMAGGLIVNDGLLTALGSGTAGTFVVSGGSGLSHGGTISLSQLDPVAGDVLDLTNAGLFTGGAGSQLALDLDLAAGAADQVLLGATTGEVQVRFNPDPSQYGVLTSGVLVLGTADGNLQATATGLQDRGLISYALEQQGTDWYVTGRLNTAPLGGIVAGMNSVQGLTDALTQPALGTAGACAAGVSSTVRGGTQGDTATTSAGDGLEARSDVTVNYGGARFDLGFGCLDLGQGDATLALGLVGAYNTGGIGQQQALAGDTMLRSRTHFATSYAGIRAQLRAGGFIANGQLGFDSTDFDLTGEIAGGSGTIINGQQTSAQRISAIGSIGYAFELAGMTLTPTVGLSASRTQTGSIQLVDLGGQVDFADHDALTAFGGLELAATVGLADGSGSIRYFASGMVYGDLADAQAVTYSDDINGATALQTAIGTTRGTLSAGMTYEDAGGASFGLSGDLSSWGGQFGAGLTFKARVAF